jgi:hypothetical protein
MNTRNQFIVFSLVLVLAAAACNLPGQPLPTPASQDPTLEAPTPQIVETTATLAPVEEYFQYWQVVEIAEYGVQIAVPCFWPLPTPQQIADAGGNFSLRNYDDAYALTFPRSNPDDIWAAGGRKIDIGIVHKENWFVAADASLEELAAELMAVSEGIEYTSVSTEEINGSQALAVFSQNNFGPGLFYLFELGGGKALLIGGRQEDFMRDPDVAAILASVGVAGQIAQVPNQLPMAPPEGLTTDCLPGWAGGTVPDQTMPGGRTSCGLHSFEDLDYLVDQVQRSLDARDFDTLQYEGFIHAPFLMGYWRSEGGSVTPAIAASTLADGLLPSANRGALAFTADPAAFPQFGTDVTGMLGPAENVARLVYSSGWGADGNGAAFLYFTTDACEGYSWTGLLYSFMPFE